MRPLDLQDAEREMLQSAERVADFRDRWGDHYQLEQLNTPASGLVPTCIRCGAYVHDLDRHLDDHAGRDELIEALQRSRDSLSKGPWLFNGSDWVNRLGEKRPS